MTDIKGPWRIVANGYVGLLWIEGVDAEGSLLGPCSVFGDHVFGFYDEATKRLGFVRESGLSPDAHQMYTGYVMLAPDDPKTLMGLAGSLDAYRGTGGSAARWTFGWYATPGPP